MMQKFSSWPIRVHLIILVALLALPSIGLIVYSGVGELNKAMVEARKTCLEFVGAVAQEEQAAVAGMQQLTVTLALLPAVQSQNVYAVNVLLRDLLKKNPQYTNITIADKSGLIWASAKPFPRNMSAANLKYFRDTLQSGLFSSGEYMVGRLTRKPILIFGYPVRNDSNEVIAVIGVGLDLEQGRSLFNMANLPSGSSFSLLDHRGIIIYRHLRDTLSEELIGRRDIRKDLFTRMQDGPDEGMFEAIGNGGDLRYNAYKKIRLTPESKPYLYVRASVPQASATSKAKQAIFNNLLILMSFFLLGLSLAWLIAQRVIVDRVLMLRQASQQLAAGTKTVSVSNVVKGGELGELAQAFDRMAEALLVREKLSQDARTALIDSEEKFSKAFYHSPILMSLSTVDDGVFVEINDQFLNVTGRSRDEVIGNTTRDLNLWVDPERRDELLDVLKKRGKVRNEPVLIRTKAGNIINMLWSGELVTINGVSYLLASAVDITERKRLEEERLKLETRLHHAAKMEALGQLAGGVAHDLNNVLGVLLGYAELLREKIPEKSPLRRYANNILQSSVKGAAIIQDLLTLARRGVAVSEVVNLNRVISDYFRSPEFENLQANYPYVTFNMELGNDLLNILGSPVHLSKTVMNLVTNAAEAIFELGDVTIRTENRYLDKPIRGYDDVKEGEYVVLTVRDTGRGISAADLGKIFEPFYTKKVMGRSGTGLGLAVVWGTVKDHQGYIDVKSEEDMGSIFTLYFPVTREALAEDQQSVPPDAFKGGGESILVVDDVKEQREVAISMLTRLGYRVDAVAGGEEALEYLKTNRVDLIVLDMIMAPGMDGLETYRGILEISPVQKAIIVSGFSETERVRKAQELGAGAYIRKPYMLEKIGRAIRDELNR